MTLQTETTTGLTTTQAPSVSTQTIPGGVQTITIPNNLPSQTSDASKGDSLNSGEIAGVVIGALAAGGIVAGLAIYFFCLRKRKAKKEEIDPDFLNPFYERPVPTPTFRTPYSAPRRKNGSGPTLTLPGFTDGRLKNGIYPNGSRRSNVSLQDNQDYSRPVLRVRLTFLTLDSKDIDSLTLLVDEP